MQFKNWCLSLVTIGLICISFTIQPFIVHADFNLNNSELKQQKGELLKEYFELSDTHQLNPQEVNYQAEEVSHAPQVLKHHVCALYLISTENHQYVPTWYLKQKTGRLSSTQKKSINVATTPQMVNEFQQYIAQKVNDYQIDRANGDSINMINLRFRIFVLLIISISLGLALLMIYKHADFGQH